MHLWGYVAVSLDTLWALGRQKPGGDNPILGPLPGTKKDAVNVCRLHE